MSCVQVRYWREGDIGRRAWRPRLHADLISLSLRATGAVIAHLRAGLWHVRKMMSGGGLFCPHQRPYATHWCLKAPPQAGVSAFDGSSTCKQPHTSLILAQLASQPPSLLPTFLTSSLLPQSFHLPSEVDHSPRRSDPATPFATPAIQSRSDSVMTNGSATPTTATPPSWTAQTGRRRIVASIWYLYPSSSLSHGGWHPWCPLTHSPLHSTSFSPILDSLLSPSLDGSILEGAMADRRGWSPADIGRIQWRVGCQVDATFP